MKKEDIKQVCGSFIEISLKEIYTIKQQAKELLTEILQQHYADFHWDFNNESTPSIMSNSFGDRPTDCYITRLYADRNNIIRIDLYTYYSGEEKVAIPVEDESDFDYLGMLEYIKNKID